MVRLLGPQDRLLRTVEKQYPPWTCSCAATRSRSTGDPAQVAAAARLVEELLVMVRGGQDLGDDRGVASARILAARAQAAPPSCSARPSSRSRGKTIRPKTLGQKLYVDAIDENTMVFGIGPAGTGKTYLAMAKAVQALQRKEVEPHHPDPPGRRGGRAARLPARHAERQDRPVPAAALRRAATR